MSDISLTASMRSNLLSLQQTQDLMDQTQERLSTGKKVNSAIDNPSSYYTAQSLTNRASDLSSLLDSMGQGIQTIQAANEAIESITTFAEQLKSIANSARDISNNMKTKLSSTREVDKTATAGTAGKVIVDSRKDMSKAEITAAAGDGTAKSLTLYVDGQEHTINFTSASAGENAAGNAKAIADAINAQGISGLTATADASGNITLQANTSVSVEAGTSGVTAKADSDTKLVTVKTDNVSVDDDFTTVEGLFTADVETTTNADGKFVITASDAAKAAGKQVSVIVTGGAKDVVGDVSGTIDTVVTDEEALSERNKYVEQYNEVLEQIDALAKDASYKGINLLQENDLKVIFNEDRSSSIEIKGVDASSKGLGLETVEKGGWNVDTAIDDAITQVEGAITELRSMASDFGNNYSIVQTREDFTENLINVLEEGADKLTLADMNEEGANMLALQTRQQLAVNSLSLASQASQAVLQLF